MCVCVCITLTNNMYITLFKPFGHLYSLFYFCNTSKTIFSLNIFNMVYIIYLIISIPVMYVALMLHLFCCWFYLCYLVSTCTLWFFGGCIFVFALLEILSLGIFWARDWSIPSPDIARLLLWLLCTEQSLCSMGSLLPCLPLLPFSSIPYHFTKPVEL